LYGGESFDAQQQQYYLRARYYDPANGRFTTEDPLFGDIFNPQTLHKYQYCLNDPVNRLDPTGWFTVAEMAVAASILGTLAMIGLSYTFGDQLKRLSPLFPDAALLGVSGTIKGLFATPAAGLLLSYAGVDISGGALAFSSLFTANATIPFAAAGVKFMQYSMLVLGFEMVFSMASAQGGAFFYFGQQMGTPSNSISVYAGLVWNMWNQEDYTGYFASFGMGAGDYGAALFFDPTDGKPIGDAFTFFSKSDGSPLSGFGNVTYYFKLYEENYGHQMWVIPAWASIAGIVTGTISKNAVAMLCSGILGIGTGYLWYKVKELPRVHGSDSSAAAYQFYLDQRQRYKRPDNWDTGSPEPQGGLELTNP
ncbi:MAG: RHS repeat-associated core domain-containing protein, partial [Verrucomicrobia subdivision 3 bacterium]|nr:RHS repeat-associated core domain-containing protein [Limisphaerales bacterium]